MRQHRVAAIFWQQNIHIYVELLRGCNNLRERLAGGVAHTTLQPAWAPCGHLLPRGAFSLSHHLLRQVSFKASGRRRCEKAAATTESLAHRWLLAVTGNRS